MYYHGVLSTTVERRSEQNVESRSSLISTGCEATALVAVEPGGFLVREACWQIHRSLDSKLNAAGRATELLGTEAYLKAGAALKAVEDAHGALPRQLTAECIKGIVQSESYLYKERGFASLEECDASWGKNNPGICWLYSNRERKTATWPEYLKSRMRGDCLFNRNKSVSIHETGDFVNIEGAFVDSFHELHVSLTLREDLVVRAEGEFSRSPDRVCRETGSLAARLENQNFVQMTKQQMAQCVGGKLGCVHLLDLILFMRQLLLELKSSSARSRC